MVEIRPIITYPEVELFQKTFNEHLGYSTVPLGYFLSGDCHGMFVDGQLLAGFCLVRGFWNLRAVRQMPTEQQSALRARFVFIYPVSCMADFTGYFIKCKKHAFRFTVYLVKTCLMHPCSRFIYSYQISEVGLGRYYSAGDPVRLHTGVPQPLEGHHGIMEPEHVEILTKWGIVKIFLRRTIKIIKKFFGG